jgi:sugar/nucleoside kinase (ribokinase family)
MPIPQILVAGGVNLDTTYRVRVIPKVGETVSTTGKSQAFGEARKRGITTVWNPSPMPDDVAPIIKLTDTLVVNETEAAELTGISGLLDDHIEQLLNMGPVEIVITLGHRGCVVINDDEVERIPTPKVAAVDPTAALCVQVRGASSSIPDRSAVQAVEQVG